VLTAKQLAGVRHTPDIVYADGDGDAWDRAFDLRGARRPTTLLVNPSGAVVWRQDGPLDAASLAAVLAKSLVAGRAVPRTLQALNLRLGRQVPNFLFELAPGHALTMRKLAGRAATVVFWRSTSRASIDVVREHQMAAHEGKEAAPLVLAVNDGEPAELARRAAIAHGLSSTLVTDPDRAISRAFGVSLWPTTVHVDANGVATSISYGRGGREHDPPPDDQMKLQPAPSRMEQVS
jgi:peroxiredoxin